MFICKAEPRVSASEIIQRKVNPHSPRISPKMGKPSYYEERVTRHLIIFRKNPLRTQNFKKQNKTCP